MSPKYVRSEFVEMLAEVSPSAADVLAERSRQIVEEGFDADHDDGHLGGTLAQAAAAYAVWPERVYLHNESERQQTFTDVFPFAPKWDRRYADVDRRDLLVKAGALILAEIDRMDRAIDRSMRDVSNGWRTDGMMRYSTLASTAALGG